MDRIADKIADQCTDMMSRRTPLPFCEQFLWLGTSVSIRTDSLAVLRAAEELGFLPQASSEERSEMRWEIARERSVVASEDWECRVTIDQRSLYLSMGQGQWFAFDPETGDGAGFVIVSGTEPGCDLGAMSYLLAVIYNIGVCELQRRHWT
jgi:hypothetical protein